MSRFMVGIIIGREFMVLPFIPGVWEGGVWTRPSRLFLVPSDNRLPAEGMEYHPELPGQ